MFEIIYRNVSIDVIFSLVIKYEDVVLNVSYYSAHKNMIFYYNLFTLFKCIFSRRKIFDKSLSLSPSISLALSTGRSVDPCYLILVAVWA